MSYPIGDLIYTLPKDICDRIAALREGHDRLRAALKRYGHHESGPDGCRYEGEGFGGAPCTCGLAEALKG